MVVSGTRHKIIYESESVASHILNLCTRWGWGWVVKFMSRQLQPQRTINNPRSHCIGGYVVSKTRGEDKYVSPAGNRMPVVQPTA